MKSRGSQRDVQIIWGTMLDSMDVYVSMPCLLYIDIDGEEEAEDGAVRSLNAQGWKGASERP